MIIHTHGLCVDHTACWAFIAKDLDGQVLLQLSGHLGKGEDMTEYRAAYEAVIQAMVWAYKAGHRSFGIRTDSEVVIKQVMGQWETKQANLVPLVERIRNALQHCECDGLALQWVPPADNEAAIHLAARTWRTYTGNAGIPDANPYIQAMEELHALGDELPPGFVTEFVENTMARIEQYGRRTNLSEKQRVKIGELVEEYLGKERLLELTGQLRMEGF